jgi:hypothetical protein
LSTTSASVLNGAGSGTGLNKTNLSANIGPDNTVVYNGALPAISSGTLTITFTTLFTFHSNNGSLWIDIQSTNATNSLPFVYAAIAYMHGGVFSRVWAGLGDFDQNNGGWLPGLVTTFPF